MMKGEKKLRFIEEKMQQALWFNLPWERRVRKVDTGFGACMPWQTIAQNQSNPQSSHPRSWTEWRPLGTGVHRNWLASRCSGCVLVRILLVWLPFPLAFHLELKGLRQRSAGQSRACRRRNKRIRDGFCWAGRQSGLQIDVERVSHNYLFVLSDTCV